MTLGEYLKQPRPSWDYRQHDCCRWADRWAVANGWPSLIGALGLTYDSERSALVTIQRGGGLVTLWTRAAEIVGLPLADDARLGDIGVIERPTHDGLNQTMGIFTGDKWASVSEHGLHCGPADVLEAWRVSHG